MITRFCVCLMLMLGPLKASIVSRDNTEASQEYFLQRLQTTAAMDMDALHRCERSGDAFAAYELADRYLWSPEAHQSNYTNARKLLQCAAQGNHPYALLQVWLKKKFNPESAEDERDAETLRLDAQEAYAFDILEAQVREEVPHALLLKALLLSDEAKRQHQEANRLGDKVYLAFNFANRAAAKGYIPARYHIAKMYLNGWGVARDTTQAVRLLSSAVSCGLAGAQQMLGDCYLEGFGVERDEQRALELFQDAFSQGFKYAGYELGCMYRDGTAVSKDSAKAAAYYEAAAKWGDMEAATNLGQLLNSISTTEDTMADAFAWTRAAAKHGCPRAQCNLAVMYQQGRVTAADVSQALYWYEKAADQGVPEAQSVLGSLYYQSTCVAPNPERARYWLRKAADQGYANAAHILGILYWQGTGGAANKDQAAKCFLQLIHSAGPDANLNTITAQLFLQQYFYPPYGNLAERVDTAEEGITAYQELLTDVAQLRSHERLNELLSHYQACVHSSLVLARDQDLKLPNFHKLIEQTDLICEKFAQIAQSMQEPGFLIDCVFPDREAGAVPEEVRFCHRIPPVGQEGSKPVDYYCLGDAPYQAYKNLQELEASWSQGVWRKLLGKALRQLRSAHQALPSIRSFYRDAELPDCSSLSVTVSNEAGDAEWGRIESQWYEIHELLDIGITTLRAAASDENLPVRNRLFCRANISWLNTDPGESMPLRGLAAKQKALRQEFRKQK